MFFPENIDFVTSLYSIYLIIKTLILSETPETPSKMINFFGCDLDGNNMKEKHQ